MVRKQQGAINDKVVIEKYDGGSKRLFFGVCAFEEYAVWHVLKEGITRNKNKNYPYCAFIKDLLHLAW